MALFQLGFLCIIAFGLAAADNTYFEEKFGDKSWEDRWIHSTFKGSQAGKFKWTAGKFYGDAEKDKGIQTSEDAKFYGVSAKFEKPFSNDGKTLVIQFQVKHEQNIDCGGGYLKVYDSTVDQKNIHGDTPYHIMFGPDICGPGTKKVHVIFTYRGKNLLTKKDIRCKDDEMTHLYTLIVRPDQTYEVKIDGEKVESGTLEADWDFLPAKKIKDPEAKKPEDWDDKKMIDDSSDKKPEAWDKPQHIPDPDAKKPDDWDDEIDGEWEPPQIDNPDYKGEWKPKQIENPNYKGEWVHPEIDNPEYKPDEKLAVFEDIGAIGFDLWQVKSGTIFDNVFVSDSPEAAEKFAKETFEVTKEGEKKMKDGQDEKERKEREEEEKKRKEEDDSKKKDKESNKEGEEEEEEEEEEDDDKKDKEAKEDESKEETKEETKTDSSEDEVEKEDETTEEAATAKDEL